MRAYRKNDDGSLEIVSVGITPDGVLTDGSRQLDPTGEVVDLMGWPDKSAGVYKNWIGTEYLIPIAANKKI